MKMDVIEIVNENVKPSLQYSEDELVPKLEPNVSYNYFFENFLLCNRPCIIKNVSDGWGSTKHWIKDKNLNVDYFKEKYKQVSVPVANCGKKVYNVQEKCMMTLEEYLNYWEERQNKKTEESFYLKDWHFTKDFPSEEIYRVPSYFASDWLNEYFCKKKDLNDDYRFVYIGPRGSW